MKEDDLLKKWLNNDLTDVEKETFSKRDDFALNQKIIEDAKHFKASAFSKPEDFKTFKQAYNSQPKVKSIAWFSPLLKIASILIIAFGIYYAFFSSDLVEERTLLAEKTTITLPDHSSVTLNADTQIEYDKKSWEDNRQLNLKGEAYFKVAKGKTFDVITDLGKVTVVGTEFNVKVRDDYFEVVCYEGIVKVTSNTKAKQLLAGDTFRILGNRFTEDKTLDVFPNWTKNKSRFKAVPLSEVFNELERQYNIKVSYKNVDAKRLFTGEFSHNKLENALSAITQPMGLTYEISSSNLVLIHGNTD